MDARSAAGWGYAAPKNSYFVQRFNPFWEQAMAANSVLQDIPGGKALFDWFGRVPRFHDAELLEIA